MRWLIGEEQKEGVLLLVLKRHFVFKSREINVKHLESRIFSVQSFEYNFHWFHRTCCLLVVVSWSDLWTQRMGNWISAQRSWWSSSGGSAEGLVTWLRLSHLQASSWGVKYWKPFLDLPYNWFLALSKHGLAPAEVWLFVLSEWLGFLVRLVCLHVVDQGQGFLQAADAHEHFEAVSAAGLHHVPFWKQEGLAVWFTAVSARRRRKAVGFAN